MLLQKEIVPKSVCYNKNLLRPALYVHRECTFGRLMAIFSRVLQISNKKQENTTGKLSQARLCVSNNIPNTTLRKERDIARYEDMPAP